MVPAYQANLQFNWVSAWRLINLNKPACIFYYVLFGRLEPALIDQTRLEPRLNEGQLSPISSTKKGG